MTKRILIAVLVLMVLSYLPRALSAQSRLTWTAPKLGVWKVTGSDEEEVNWSGSIKFETRKRVGSLDKYRGHFNWRSLDGKDSGREYFTGSFNGKTGRFTIVGIRVTRAKGNIGTGRYWSHVRNKGRRLANGTWGGKDVVKGTWSAVWIRSR